MCQDYVKSSFTLHLLVFGSITFLLRVAVYFIERDIFCYCVLYNGWLSLWFYELLRNEFSISSNIGKIHTYIYTVITCFNATF